MATVGICRSGEILEWGTHGRRRVWNLKAFDVVQISFRELLWRSGQAGAGVLWQAGVVAGVLL